MKLRKRTLKVLHFSVNADHTLESKWTKRIIKILRYKIAFHAHMTGTYVHAHKSYMQINK